MREFYGKFLNARMCLSFVFEIRQNSKKIQLEFKFKPHTKKPHKKLPSIKLFVRYDLYHRAVIIKYCIARIAFVSTAKKH